LSLMDSEALFKNFEGMEEVVADIAAQYFIGYPKLLEAINSSINNNDSKGLERSAHTLKGMVSNFRAEEPRLVAYELESLGHNENFSGAPELLTKLKGLLNTLDAEIREAVKKVEAA
jgi:two-component system, sensor histidine kinase and response regulator